MHSREHRVLKKFHSFKAASIFIEVYNEKFIMQIVLWNYNFLKMKP